MVEEEKEDGKVVDVVESNQPVGRLFGHLQSDHNPE